MTALTGAAELPQVQALVSAYGSARGEKHRLSEIAGATMYADVRNPSATVAYTLAPCEIRVSFGQGEIYSPDQMQVLDDTGAAVAWQWEPGRDLSDDSSIERWSDGSLRAGSIWVATNLAAGQTKRFIVRLHGAELGQSFTPSVSYTVVSAAVEEYATSVMRARFESAQQWMLRRYQDIGNASFDLFSGSNGLHVVYQPQSGQGKFSYTAADVSGLVRSRPSAGSFGEGVVFRDWRVSFAWAVDTSVTVTVDYRMFSDGSIRIRHRQAHAATVTTGSKQLFLRMSTGTTGLTGSTDATRELNRYDYTGSSFLWAAVDVVRDYPTRTAAQVHTPAQVFEAAQHGRVGWTGSTEIPAGAFFLNTAWLCKYTAGAQNDEHIRRHNIPVAFAAVPKRRPDRLALRDRAIALIDEAQNVMTTGEWGGVMALCQLARGSTAAAALAQFQSWATANGLNPSSISSWYSLWTGNTGMEYTGRNSQVLWWLREAFTAAGDTTNRALVEGYIHAYADSCVQAEAASGGAGLVWLRLAAGTPAWNGGTTAMAAIAASLAITADTTRQTVYDRILAAYVAGAWAGQLWNYDGLTSVPVSPSGHYYLYQTYELAIAKYRRQATVLPTGSLCAYIRANLNPEGEANDWRWTLQYRRGRESTQYYAAACLVMLERDYSTAYECVRRIAALPKRYQSTGIDGFGATAVSNIAQDVRCLAELMLSGAI